jgi:hypothetical protein
MATAQDRKNVRNCLAKLYEAWHAAEPGKGYDAKAAKWRRTLAGSYYSLVIDSYAYWLA